VAISIYVLVALLKKELRLDRSLYEILQILSLTLFENMPISRALSQMTAILKQPDPRKQLSLFTL
jgi:hypothetical protein